MEKTDRFPLRYMSTTFIENRRIRSLEAAAAVQLYGKITKAIQATEIEAEEPAEEESDGSAPIEEGEVIETPAEETEAPAKEAKDADLPA